MGLTVTEKIIAAAADVTEVSPGQIFDVPVDLIFMHDNNAPIAIKQFAKLPVTRVWDPNRVYFVLDHHSPSTTLRSARHQKDIRNFAQKYSTTVIDVGRGISHPVMAEEGHARPGRIILGTDSHTVGLGIFGCLATGIGSTEAAAVLGTGKIWLKVPETIKAVLNGKLSFGVSAKDVALYLLRHFGPSSLNYMTLEFEGPLLKSLSVDERMTINIMCLEMGVKNALMPVDKTILNYLGSSEKHEKIFMPDSNASYSAVTNFDISKIEPMVATPGLPTNGVAVGEVEGIKIHQSIVGSCSGAFYHDLVQAAEIVNGKKIHPEVRFIIVPNSARVVMKAARTGVIATLVEAGVIISSPSCGPCAGYEIGCLAPGEVCISTTTRNMDGRMGPNGKIYLASARTAAASALAGQIVDPRIFMVKKHDDR